MATDTPEARAWYLEQLAAAVPPVEHRDDVGCGDCLAPRHAHPDLVGHAYRPVALIVRWVDRAGYVAVLADGQYRVRASFDEAAWQDRERLIAHLAMGFADAKDRAAGSRPAWLDPPP